MSEILWDSDFPGATFYAEKNVKKTKNNSQTKLFLITLAPFAPQIVRLFLNTVSTLFLQTKLQTSQYYHPISIVWTFICFVYIFFEFKNNRELYLDNKKDEFYNTDIFYFSIFVFFQTFVNHCLHQILHSSTYTGESLKALQRGLNNINATISLVLGVVCVVYYGFCKHIITNSYKKIFYSEGIYEINGKYVVKEKHLDKEQALYVAIYIFYGFCFMIILAVGSMKLSEWINQLLTGNETLKSANQEQHVETIKKALQPPTKGSTKKEEETPSMLSIIIQVLFWAPIYEEIFYRHVIMKLNNYTASSAFLSSFIFSLVHLRNEPIWIFIQFFIPSIVFTYFYYKNRNIICTICIHFLNNLLALCLVIKEAKYGS